MKIIISIALDEFDWPKNVLPSIGKEVFLEVLKEPFANPESMKDYGVFE